MEIHFTSIIDWNDQIEGCHTTAFFAYLILPAEYIIMKSCSGPQGVTFHSSMFVDLSIVKEPTPEQKARFQRAMKKLCLEPHLEHQQMMPPHPMSDLYLLEEEKLQKTQDHEGNIVSYELSKQRPIQQ